MELVQYKGPFAAGSRLTVPAQFGYTYVHIGIELPKSQPIGVPETILSNNNKTTTSTGRYRAVRSTAKLEINGTEYQINANDILEFDDLAEVEWNIRFLSNLPAETIIDIVWRN